MEVIQVQQKETPTPYQGIQKLFPQIYSNPGQPNSWILVNVSRGIVYRGTVPTLELTFALMTEDGLEGATATYAFENISKSLILAHGDTG